MGTILLIILILFLLGAIPARQRFGYWPGGVVTILLIVLLILLFTNILPWGWH